MSKIFNALKNNPHLSNPGHTCFTLLLDEIEQTLYGNKNDIKYIHGLVSYNGYNKDTDLFCFIQDRYLEDLKKGKIFFIFDASTEGYSPILQMPLFDMLYWNCHKYEVDPKQIIYVSANLKDENNINIYCQERNYTPINVFSFPSFEMVIPYDDTTIEKKILETRSIVRKNYKGKYFSSLSRRNRQYRTTATFLLCQDTISERALISHDQISRPREISIWKSYHGLEEFSDAEIEKWMLSLPLTIDRKDFEINWALDRSFRKIHDKTIFQIANETEMNDYDGTALFLSEKTFRPISQLQPFVIYGQPGSNYMLKELGYQLYDEWFDLSFDSELDHVLRYKKLLISVKDACRQLDGLNKKQQIDWRFKNTELLIHNYTTMCKQQHSRNKLMLFLEKIINDRSSC
jgi:hypothetical protein